MTQGRHTPTPWYPGTESETDICFWLPVPTTGMRHPDWDGVSGIVASSNIEAKIPWEERIENGKFILRACNAHDELVAALTKARHFVDMEHEIARRKLGEYSEMPEGVRRPLEERLATTLAEIDAALAKARGEEVKHDHES